MKKKQIPFIEEGKTPDKGNSFLSAKFANLVIGVINDLQDEVTSSPESTDTKSPDGSLLSMIHDLQDQITIIGLAVSNYRTYDGENPPNAEQMANDIDGLRNSAETIKGRVDDLVTGLGNGDYDFLSKSIKGWLADPANDAMFEALGLDPDDLRTKTPQEQATAFLKALTDKITNTADGLVYTVNAIITTLGKIQLELYGIDGNIEQAARTRLETIKSSEQLYSPLTTNIGCNWTTLSNADDSLYYVLTNATTTSGEPWNIFWASSVLGDQLKGYAGMKARPEGVLVTVERLKAGLTAAQTTIEGVEQSLAELSDTVTQIESRLSDAEGTIENHTARIETVEVGTLRALINNAENDAIWTGYGLTGESLRGMTTSEQTKAVFAAMGTKLVAYTALQASQAALDARLLKVETYCESMPTNITALPVIVDVVVDKNAGTAVATDNAALAINPFV